MSDDVVGQPQPGQEAAAQAFRCSQCAGEMQWDAAAGGLRCQYCDHVEQVTESEGGASVVEYDLEQGLAASRSRGFGAPVRTTVCKACGASVSFGDNVTATKCDFCDSPQVMEQEANRNLITPESLVPFAVEKKAATDKFSSWLKGLWFRPSDLKHKAEVDDMNGVYVPYWTFDAQVASDWTAQAGYYYYVSESYTDTDANGNTVTKTRQVRKIRWEWTSGHREDFYDDVLVCASKGLPHELANRLTTFDTNKLIAYAPSYLAGWKAEEYAVDLNAGWKTAVGEIESGQRARCSRDVPGDTQRFLNVRNRFSSETFKHVLLPIWIASYRYKDEVYRFLVNGQTGEVAGKAPLSWFKIIAFSLVVIAAIVGIVLLVRHLKG